MRHTVACWTLLTVIALAAGPVWGAPKEDDGPDAARVVVRGKKKLVDALEAAAQPAWANGKPRPVLFVVDVTPPTQKWQAKIAEALTALEARAKGVSEWRIAALGSKPTKSMDAAGSLAFHLDGVLAKETDVANTVASLRKTLRSWRPKKGVVVYLADWHFEDDFELEDFIEELAKKGRTLSVVGTEAAFGRAWNDGIRETGERLEDSKHGIAFEDYWKNVGRDAFGNRDAKAPWHGGDTAYPYGPYRWDWHFWETAFSESDWDRADFDEDIADVMGDASWASSFRRRLELILERAGVQRRLDDVVPGSAEAKHLEERKAALEDEIAALEKEEAEAEEEEEQKPDEEVEKLKQELADVHAKQDALFQKLLATDDEGEEEKLKAEHETLSKEAVRLEEAITNRQAEIDAQWGKELERLRADAEKALEAAERAKAEAEELERRLPGKSAEPEEEEPPWIDTSVDKYREFPLPSTFGPYGLMRAAGVTGGRYVLWSWNPSGRKNVVLEYTRCNLFPPDLRSRKAIRADLKKNPFASSLLRAWWVIVNARTELLEHTPPLLANLRSPALMQRTETYGSLSGLWENPSEQKQYGRLAQRSVAALDEATAILDKGIEKGGEPKEPVLRRYHAEALRFRHAARVVRFELTEALAASKLIDKRSWRDKKEHGVLEHTWVGQGRVPERVRAHAGVVPFDPAAGQALIEERKALLERFRGTPFGEELALNAIETARTTDWERVDKVPGTGRSPTESVELPKPTPKPPGSGSGGGGPTTGGG